MAKFSNNNLDLIFEKDIADIESFSKKKILRYYGRKDYQQEQQSSPSL